MRDLYIIPDLNTIEKSCELLEKYNAYFEYNDFYVPNILDNEKEINRILCLYKSLPRKRNMDIVHGAFFDVTIFSSDKKIKEISRLRVEQSLAIGEQLGVRAVIFHTNYISNFTLESYQMGWLSQNEEFWGEMLLKYPSLEIYMENMFDNTPYLLGKLGERMKLEKRFGICFDYAHSAVSTTSQLEWMKILAPYIKHIHLNDNDLVSDIHEIVGRGKINWQEYSNLLKEYTINSTVLVEVNGSERQEKSIKYMMENRIYPFT